MSRGWSMVGWGVLAVLALAPERAAAQVFTPSFLSPVRSSDTGVYLAGGFGPSDDLALEAIHRRAYGIFDLGLRAGLGDSGAGVVVMLGADYRNPLELDTAPIALAATGGVQVALGGRSGLGADVGISLGSTFTPEGVSVTPYVHPRLALVETLREESVLGLEILADLGVDVQLPGSLTGRLALGLGGPTADLSIGLAWR